MAAHTKPRTKEKETRLAREKRDKLVLKHMPLVKYVADRLAARLPRHVDLEDLIESGMVGLLDAADRFDPLRNVQFSTFAVTRIRGAILDYLRAADWLPRSMRNEIAAVEKARNELKHEKSRPPTTDELVERTGLDVKKLRKVTRVAERCYFHSLENMSSDGVTDEYDAPHIKHDPEVHPLQHVILEEDKQLLADAISRLSETERLVITLYYFEDLKLRDIAEVLEVTDSRVCQIHRAALRHLQEMMDHPKPLQVPAGVA